MAEMVAIYDLDGNNQISMIEFETLLLQFGYKIIDGGRNDETGDGDAGLNHELKEGQNDHLISRKQGALNGK